MFTGTGYSYGVDIWAVGIVMYNLLYGGFGGDAPTFSEKKLSKLSVPARNILKAMLEINPKIRPKADQLAQFEFLCGEIPTSLPKSCLVRAPNAAR